MDYTECFVKKREASKFFFNLKRDSNQAGEKRQCGVHFPSIDTSDYIHMWNINPY